MNIELDTKEVLKKYNKIVRNLKELSSKKCIVQFDELAEYESEDETGVKVQEVAMWMEYGSDEFNVHYPSRPFWRTALKLYEPQIRRRFEHNFKRVAEGKMSATECFEDLGKQMREYIKKTIYSGNFAPLSESTLRKRAREGKGNTPLLDTELMVNSIEYKVM